MPCALFPSKYAWKVPSTLNGLASYGLERHIFLAHSKIPPPHLSLSEKGKDVS